MSRHLESTSSVSQAEHGFLDLSMSRAEGLLARLMLDLHDHDYVAYKLPPTCLHRLYCMQQRSAPNLIANHNKSFHNSLAEFNPKRISFLPWRLGLGLNITLSGWDILILRKLAFRCPTSSETVTRRPDGTSENITVLGGTHVSFTICY